MADSGPPPGEEAMQVFKAACYQTAGPAGPGGTSGECALGAREQALPCSLLRAGGHFLAPQQQQKNKQHFFCLWG